MIKEVKKHEQHTLPRATPATDIIEKEDGFHIFLDMPGTRKEDLVVDLDKDQVKVSGKTYYPADPSCLTAECESAEKKCVHMEFGGGEYRRTFTISDTVDREKIVAKLENGVLDLFLPKSEKNKPRRITITAG